MSLINLINLLPKCISTRLFFNISYILSYLYQYVPFFDKLGPLRVVLQITHQCNLRCEHCFEKNELETDKSGELRKEEIFKIIDTLPPWTILDISGGEPFVRDDLIEILEYLKKKGRLFTFITNGVGIEHDRFLKALECSPLCIMFSIDGLRETHDKIRNKYGAFDSVIKILRQAIRFSVKEKALVIKTKSVLSTENINETSSMIEVFRSDEVAEVQFDVMMNNPYPCGLKFFQEWDDLTAVAGNNFSFLKDLVNQSNIELVFASKGVTICPQLKDRSMLREYLIDPTQFSITSCRANFTDLYISSHGELSHCFHKRLGRIQDFDYNIKKAFTSKDFKKEAKIFHQSLNLQQKLCSGCPRSRVDRNPSFAS